ncbi:hemerythrin domain-containing protein [Comamonas odontotermitis]|uniref:hemerythrin domain-containing protein n=1 Tax=Comamonas odontotermitis TaxID=379895 RepID=UPI001CC7C83C|nr:hemerythrin domain-containing protein [Comamonas odontotermitis]UBB17303.1 hemerythrin domain-containing protein [Comamonas odontotermitis]
MAVTLQLHTLPSAGFDEPFGMLHACHGRVERTLALLSRLGEYLAAQGGGVPDEQARDAAADVQRYFDLAAPLHHQDEELHVFPVLRASGAKALADALQAEHERMETLWQPIRADLQAVHAGNALSSEEMAEARVRWADFAALYARHIAAEEELAYPQAQTCLGLHEQFAMGRDMAQRRGVRYPDSTT